MDTLGDLDLVVESGEVVLADAAGVVGERLRRVESGVLVVRAAGRGSFRADHRGVPHVGVVVPEVHRGAFASLRGAGPGELRERRRCDQGERARQNLSPGQIFRHIKLLS